MHQRWIKVILPENYKQKALEILENQDYIYSWQDESYGDNFVAGILTDLGHSEVIMDLFEKRFSAIDSFRLIMFPIEASIPRIDVSDEQDSASSEKKTETEKAATSRISREELYTDIVDSTKLSKMYILMTVLSTVVVAIGLVKNNVAVIIGAMVIAPFLGPNVALALSTSLADKKLGLNALKTLVTGILIVLTLSVCMGYFLNTNPAVPEIASRTRADLSDIILALASGSAGVLAFTTGASSAVIGVMVAVALLPPLAVCGLLLGAHHFHEAFGAFLLFITNIICINLTGVITLLAQGVSPRRWWEADKAKKATRKALILWSVILAVLAMVIFLWQIEIYPG